ncbi:hypothetical protein [Pseudoalteromonas maricaloris]|uniref:hypothetical protein n=1 Tax=Pseudoalteromonas maricaloris TaxID=184924 RepID=UPI003C2A3A41
MITLNCISTSSGKLEHIRKLLSSSRVLKVVPNMFVEGVVEETCGHLNALSKLAHARKYSSGPILVSDETLEFIGMPEDEQPRAMVRRTAGLNATDEEVIMHYESIFKKNDTNKINGLLKSYYAIDNAKGKREVFVLQESMAFRCPPARIFVKDRPLSSFHYLESYGCFFSELDDKEKTSYIRKKGKNLVILIEDFLSDAHNNLKVMK